MEKLIFQIYKEEKSRFIGDSMIHRLKALTERIPKFALRRSRHLLGLVTFTASYLKNIIVFPLLLELIPSSKRRFFKLRETFWERSDDFRKVIKEDVTFQEYKKLSIKRRGPSLLFLLIPTSLALFFTIIFFWGIIVPLTDKYVWFWIVIVHVIILISICTIKWLDTLIDLYTQRIFWQITALFSMLKYREEQEAYLNFQLSLEKKSPYLVGIAFFFFILLSFVFGGIVQTIGLSTWYGNADTILILASIFLIVIMIFISRHIIFEIKKVSESLLIIERLFSVLRLEIAFGIMIILKTFYLYVLILDLRTCVVYSKYCLRCGRFAIGRLFSKWFELSNVSGVSFRMRPQSLLPGGVS